MVQQTQIQDCSMRPSISFVHSEHDRIRSGADGAFGLSAGYLSTRVLSAPAREVWTELFSARWDEACSRLAEQLVRDGVDSFTLVPCSRQAVEEGLRKALCDHGLREWRGLIAKAAPDVSFAGRDLEFLVRNTRIRSGIDIGATKVAICDDYAETGRTLFGLYDVLRADPSLSHLEFVLAAVGVSESLAQG
jgi:hypothetical protein